ncbi:MAG: hypothetical protein RL545_261, partial [Actinomycetota bacterium]
MKLGPFEGLENEVVVPDASRELEFIAPAIIEVIEGARSVTQLGGLINEDVYQMLRKRSIDLAHRRKAMGLK